MLRVLVIGSRGKLGAHAVQCINASAEYELVPGPGRGEVTEERLRDSGAKLGLDATAAGCGLEHGLVMLAAGLRPLVGTSGVDLAQTAELDGRARELGLGGLVVPNFSLGMWLLQRAAVEAARFYPRVEIVETHSDTKLDSPSATALQTAHLMENEAARGGRASVPIHSLRLPGAFARQEVVLAGGGEVLRWTHETSGHTAYTSGILAGLAHVATAKGVERGIGLAFEKIRRDCK